MVSFWPFGRRDDTSAASFEKVLSQLSTKIGEANSYNEGFRQKQRRFKVIWTLYTAFAYTVGTLFLTLVTGWQQWNAVEYSVVAGGPVVIYGVRTALDRYYKYRVAHSQAHLNELQKQRENAIQKLKAATKYDSTQQLLDKYGGKPQTVPQPPGKRKPNGDQQDDLNPSQSQRTGFAPPPTANITKRVTSGVPRASSPGISLQTPARRVQALEPGEEFAPNAFSAAPPASLIRQPSTQYQEGGPKWYDRILDVMLGEDETQAKNRMALICQSCRLVNGQAAPGARTVDDIGRWRCGSCQAWNGVESEERKVLRQIANEPHYAQTPTSVEIPSREEAREPIHRREQDSPAEESDPEEDEGEELEDTDSAELPARTTRNQIRNRKKT